MKYRFMLLSLLVSGAAAAQSAAPLADDDTFTTPAETPLTVEGPGVLGNDVDTDDALAAVLVAGTANGILRLNRDGSFTYTPNAGFTGTDTFTYVAEEATPEVFVVDTTRSGVRFNATLDTPIGGDTDSDSSTVGGTLTAEVVPNTAPFTEIHARTLDLTLTEALSLTFDFGFLGGRLNVDTDPDSMQLSILQPGPAAPVVDAAFMQVDNEIGITGTLHLNASGLISTVVADGPIGLDIAAMGDLSGAITQQDTLLHLNLPVQIAGTFDVEGNAVDVTLTGHIAATAPVLPPPQISNVATVSLVVGGVGTATEASAEVPDRFILEQNYPNPFHPVTRIGYLLPAASEVEIIVYDVLGRAVATLVDAPQPAGRYEARFDASGLPSGVYVYRLQAGSFTETKTLIVRK